MGPDSAIEIVNSLSTAEAVALWLTAVGTIAAALVPTLLFLLERREKNRLQERLDAEPARQAQLEANRELRAALLNARAVFVRTQLHTQAVDDKYQTTVVVQAHNRTSEAVWDVRAYVRINGQDLDPALDLLELQGHDVSRRSEHFVTTDDLPLVDVDATFITWADSRGDHWRTFANGTSEKTATAEEIQPKGLPNVMPG